MAFAGLPGADDVGTTNPRADIRAAPRVRDARSFAARRALFAARAVYGDSVLLRANAERP